MYIAVGYASDDINLVYTAVGYARPISQLAYTAVGQITTPFKNWLRDRLIGLVEGECNKLVVEILHGWSRR